MLERLAKDDPALQGAFMRDEVPYNLIYRMLDNEASLCLKAADGHLLFAQTPGLNGWLWASPHVSPAQRAGSVSALIGHLADWPRLPGVTGFVGTAALFAQAYAATNGLTCSMHMSLGAYICQKVRKPRRVPGELRLADGGDEETVAAFLAGFARDAHGEPATPESKRPAAAEAIGTGNLYLWIADGRPASMANIAHRSPRHGRINAVYTPPEQRGRGYAGAVVAGLSARLLKEGLTPMLYADAANPLPARAYRRVGFERQGSVADIRFDGPG